MIHGVKDMGRSAVLIIGGALALALAITGCGGKERDGRITVIATLFPQYDFVRQIAKDRVHARLLLRPGVEPHSFEPAPRDIVDMSRADLFIYTGDFMEPWAGRMAKGVKNEKLIVVDAGKNIRLIDAPEHDEQGAHTHDDGRAHHDDHRHGAHDPHIWVDPVNVLSMIDAVTEGLVRADPANGDFYRINAASYRKEIEALHRDFLRLFDRKATTTIIHAGHFAFGYFTRRYGLKYVSPYKGFSPDAEPSPGDIAALIKTVRTSGTRAIFYEELIDPKIARVISEQTGARMLLLHGAHNVSKKEMEEGATYISIMRGNMERLREGLGLQQ